MSKVLVVAYSYTGTSRQVAKLLCSQHDWQMAEITEVRPRGGFFGTVRCMLDSQFRLKPAIRYQGPPPQNFSVVVLVSPIWLMRLAGPMRSFVAQHRGDLPGLAVVSVMGGEGAPNAVAEIASLSRRTPILSTAVTAREVNDGSCAGRLQAFGTAIQSAEDSKTVLRPADLSPQAI